MARYSRQTGVGELAFAKLTPHSFRLSRKTKNVTGGPASLTPCVPSISYPIRARIIHCSRGVRGKKNLDIRFTPTVGRSIYIGNKETSNGKINSTLQDSRGDHR
jgi:hypothetical protein